MEKGRAMTEKQFVRYDSADYLKAEENLAAYLEAVVEDGGDNLAYVARALGVVARARDMTALACQVGMSRIGLNKALSGEGNPTLSTVLKVARALGLKVSIQLQRDTLTQLADLKQRLRENPEVREEYAKADVEFALIKAMMTARREANLTQAKLAEKVGITQSAIARLEAGRVSPSISILQRYAEATGHQLQIGFVEREKVFQPSDENS